MTGRRWAGGRRWGGGLLAAVLLSGCAGDPSSDAPVGVAPRASAAGQGPPEATAGRSPDLARRRLPVPAAAQAARVVRHVDGDTLVLQGEGIGPLPGAATRTRLLHIDTPEVFDPPECYGPEASARTTALLPVGAQVRVQADVDPRDRFGRTLLLVWDEQGRSVQEVLLGEGAARILAVGPNRRYLRELRLAERAARDARSGLWGAC